MKKVHNNMKKMKETIKNFIKKQNVNGHLNTMRRDY